MAALHLQLLNLFASSHVRGGKPWKYEWSSARVHCGMEKDDYLRVKKLFRYIEGDEVVWQEFIDEKESPLDLEDIKKNTLRGSVLGDEGFIKKLEKKLGRSLVVKERGRPRKVKTN